MLNTRWDKFCFYLFNWLKRRSKLVQQLKKISIVSILQITYIKIGLYIHFVKTYIYFYLGRSITNDWIVHAIRQPFYRTARPIPTHGPIECTLWPTTLWSRILISTPYEFIGFFHIIPIMTCLQRKTNIQQQQWWLDYYFC